ncbi:MAG: glycosyltransferase family A protein [Brumimicrobium sp.]
MDSNKDKVKFSIIVPTYNRAHLIGKTVDSILSQTYKNFELIIVDDGSTDNTEDVILKNYPNQVRYYKKQNAERAAARNFGTQQALGKYVLWFDSDDIMYPNHLEVANKLLVNKNQPELMALSHHYLNSDNEVISVQVIPENVNELLYKGNFFACNAVVVRKDIALENLFNEDRDLTASEDYELWLRLGSQYTFHTAKKITWALIIHEERSVATMDDSTKLILRFEKFLKYTTENKQLMKFLGKKASYFIMKNYLILAVDLALNKHKKEAVKYLKKAIKADKSVFFTRPFYATLKHLVAK